MGLPLRLVAIGILLTISLAAAQRPAIQSPWVDQRFTQASNLECRDPEDLYTLPEISSSIYESSDPDVLGEVHSVIETIDEEVDYLSRTSDFAVDAQDSARASCVLHFVKFWALRDAFHCQSTDSAGTRYYRARLTAGVGAAFLKGTNAIDWDHADMQLARGWFQEMQYCNRNWTLVPLQQMGAAGAEGNDTIDPHNAAFSGLLSLLLTSTILNDENTFLWAADQLNTALDTVLADGTTINEQDEEADTLFHHSSGILMYALPATLMVHANVNTTWNVTSSYRDTAGNAGLARLAWRTANALYNPDFYNAKTGVTQADVSCTEESWGWLYWNLLQDASVHQISVAAAANLSITHDINSFRNLVDRCNPEHTFTGRLGGRTCWWYPSTFYGSPCTGWTEGPLFALAVSGLAVASLATMCCCFLCHRDSCMACVSNKKNKVATARDAPKESETPMP